MDLQDMHENLRPNGELNKPNHKSTFSMTIELMILIHYKTTQNSEWDN